MKESYLLKPPEVEVFRVHNGTDIILRRNIEEKKNEEETCWECEEKQIRCKGTVEKEDVENNFEHWWNLDKKETEPTVADRLDAIEEAIMELAEVMANG
jgi:hypothetical protein